MPNWELSEKRQSQILGVLLGALGVLTAISVLTYHASDWPHELGVRYFNACGPVGAWFSFALVWLLGRLAAWAVPVTLLAWGWNRIRCAEPGELAVRTLIGSAVTLVAISLAGLWLPEAWAGRTGTAIAGQVSGLFHPVGSVIFLGTLLTVLLLVASEVGFSMLADGVVQAVSVPARWVSAFMERFGPATKKERRKNSRVAAREEAPSSAGTGSPRIVREPGMGAAAAMEADAEGDDLPLPSLPARRSAPQIHLPLPGMSRGLAEKSGKPAKESKVSAPLPAAVTNSELPPASLLSDPVPSGEQVTEQELKAKAAVLERTLAEFGVLGQVREVHPGPVVTMFEIEPAPGVKVNQIVTRSDDLALALRASRIRIVAPIPGKAAVGIEVPNPHPQTVYVKEVMESEAMRGARGALMLALGKDTSGKVYVTDLAKCPHLLVAGATGSGKSVGMNVIMASLLLRHSPETLRFLLIDPKMLELTGYNGMPHLLWPVVTQAKPAARALRWVVQEMERRYKTLSGVGVRNIEGYNKAMETREGGEKLPYIVVMVDELADLMLTLPMEIEEPIARLAQMARAVGIHLVLATQRPSVDVITGVIKANFPSRMAFQVASKVDSRTILDQNGADALLGNGDMLFMLAGRPEPVRVHGAYISESDVEALAGFWRAKNTQEAPTPPMDLAAETSGGSEDGEAGDDDDLVAEAARVVVLSQRGSVSLLQRRLKVGYSRAGRIMDQLESIGVVGPFTGSQAREVLVDERYLEEKGLLSR